MDHLLKQTRLLIYSTTVSLKDSHHVTVEERAGFSVTQRTLPLDAINPNPIKVRSARFGWAIASACMVTVTGVVLYGSFQDEGLHLGVFTVALMLGLLAAVSIAKTAGEFRSLYVYTEAQTNRSLFAIRSNSPNAATVETFVETLGKHIKALRYPEGLSPQQRIEHHKRHVRFLLEEGVLTPEEHESIAARLEKKARPAEVVNLVTGDI